MGDIISARQVITIMLLCPQENASLVLPFRTFLMRRFKTLEHGCTSTSRTLHAPLSLVRRRLDVDLGPENRVGTRTTEFPGIRCWVRSTRHVRGGGSRVMPSQRWPSFGCADARPASGGMAGMYRIVEEITTEKERAHRSSRSLLHLFLSSFRLDEPGAQTTHASTAFTLLDQVSTFPCPFSNPSDSPALPDIQP